MATRSTIIRRPRFTIRFITEKSEHLIEYDASGQVDDNFMNESIIALTAKNSMTDDSGAFAITLAGDQMWDKILNENDLVIIRIEPNEQNPNNPLALDDVRNPTVVVGLISEVRVEADYADDIKMYRITGQSLQKAFIQFNLQTIRQAGMISPSTVGWMDFDVRASSGGSVGGTGSTTTTVGQSNQTPAPPLSTISVSSEYGQRWGRMHYGIDLRGSTGTPVYTVLDGVVAETGYNGTSGNYIIIQHNDTYYTQYFHLNQRPTLSTGSAVSQGDTIGYLGNTGSSTGPHLHFGVATNDPWGAYASGGFVNPREFMGNSLSVGGMSGTTNDPSGGGGERTTLTGGFSQLLMGKTAEEVVMSLVERFTEAMEYDFDGAKDGGIPYDDIFDNRVLFSFNTWKEDESLQNPLPITSYEGSFNNLIRSAAPKPYLEYFWDTDVADASYGEEKAVMYVRRTPFDRADWNRLDSHTITSRTVLSESVAKNDLEAYSIYNCVPALTSDELSLASAVPYYHPSLVAKYGYSLLEVENIYINMEGAMNTEGDGESEDNSHYNTNSMPAKYAERLFNWYYHNPNFFSGEITIVGHPDLRMGNKLIYQNIDETELWEYYIESVEHNFSYSDGYTTTLGVTRGLRIANENDDGGRFSMVPAPEVFRGGYLGEMSYQELEAAYEAEQASLGSGNSLSATSTGAGGPVAKQAAEHAVRFAKMDARDTNTTGYDWGGGRGTTNPFKGNPPYYADCSSFVYWMFDLAGVRLGNSTGVTTWTLLKEPQLQVIGDVGSNVTEGDLQVGDIVFFRGDSGHVGIYVGGGDFVGMNGSGYKNLARGVERKPLFSGYWKSEFKGQVRRLK